MSDHSKQKIEHSFGKVKKKKKFLFVTLYPQNAHFKANTHMEKKYSEF